MVWTEGFLTTFHDRFEKFSKTGDRSSPKKFLATSKSQNWSQLLNAARTYFEKSLTKI